jgi:FkbM family methyltransferase
VYVTRETTVRNPYTWTADGRAYESTSIEYVYRKLEERARARGSARLLDVGAQSGLYALYARHFDGVVVDAYEPFAESYACLVDNIALNGVGDKVRAFAVALSDAEGTRAMRYTPEHTGLNTLGASPVRFSGGSEVQVVTRTIDGIYAATRVDVIKVDTEGWEYFILLGGREVLRRDRPELLLEVNDENMRQCGVARDALFALLAELGYSHVATIDGENMAFSAR